MPLILYQNHPWRYDSYVHGRQTKPRRIHPTYNSAIDVVKTRIQIDPELARHSLLSGGRKIVAAEVPKGLMTGFGPTAVGYLVKGGAKFAGYEF